MKPGASWSRIGLTVLLGAFVASLPVFAQKRSSPETRTDTWNETVFKPMADRFTGTVRSEDPKAMTIAVEGHHPIEREIVQKLVAHDQRTRENRKSAEPLAFTNAVQTFKLDPMCTIATSNNPVARLNDIQVGDQVDVVFRRMAGEMAIATSIQPAGKHPYDIPAAPKKPKR